MPSSILRVAPAVGLAAALVIGCAPPPSDLDRVRKAGVLRVVTRALPVGVTASPVHLERRLARAFAARLGVEAAFVEHRNPAAVRAALADGAGDLAAAALVVRAGGEPGARIGPHYRVVDEVVVYRRGSPRPESVADLAGAPVPVPAGRDDLAALVDGSVTFAPSDERDVPAILGAVWRKEHPVTIASGDFLGTFRAVFPELEAAFPLAERRPVAWLFPRGDDSLYRAAIHFFNDLRHSGDLARALAEQFGHHRHFDYVATRRLIRQIRRRLPAFEAVFRAAAGRTGLDWRLLAAVGYQESHWNPDAVSATGVKGIMMLTELTAQQVGVTHREDPEESIHGGARYLASLLARLPADVPATDRPWFALAAYNIGFGHLSDARDLTALTAGDPARWADVRARLPLLRQSLWYARTTYGQARGHEAVDFVEKVRRAQRVLTWYRRDG